MDTFTERLNLLAQDEYQKLAMQEVCELRLKDGDTNPLDWRLLHHDRAFYVLNDEFPKEVFDINDVRRMDMYFKINDKEFCKYYQRLVIPVRDVKDKPIALNAYSNSEDPKYMLSNKVVWDRNKYFFARKWDYETAIRRRYVIITDGTMDKYWSNMIGEPAFGLFGSQYSQYQLAILRLFDYIIPVPDNDPAGNKLVTDLSDYGFTNIRPIYRTFGKDLDDYCKRSKTNMLNFKAAVERMKKSNFMYPSLELDDVTDYSKLKAVV